MFRFLLVITTVCVFHGTPADAQGRGRWFRGSGWGQSAKWGRSHRQPASHSQRYREPTLFGFSIGVGSYPPYNYPRPGEFNPNRFDSYLYDPYRFGSFTAPDLLNDPYFRERHRYDSHFPGRRQTALQLAPTVSRPSQPAYRSDFEPPQPTSPPVLPANPAEVVAQLQSAADQLSHSLSARKDDGESWMEYLAPNKINVWIANANVSELRELLTHYDGVVANPELKSVTRVHGFAATRSLLSQYVNQLSATESMPTPASPL